MTSILEEKHATFRFYDSFNKVEDEYCDVIVNVKKVQYTSGKKYFDISYSSIYSKDSLKGSIKINPLYRVESNEDIYEGDIIYVNPFTEKLIEYLLMSYDDLSNFSGSVTVEQYKEQIIKTINLFWD